MPVKFSSLLFFSADNRRHVPCRDWSRWALRLCRLDTVACGYSRNQRINTPRWWIPRLANKAGVHSRTEWHTALCILYVCRGTILCGWSDCSLHDYHVPECLLWGNWRAYNHRHNIHSGAALHKQGIVTVLSCKVRWLKEPQSAILKPWIFGNYTRSNTKSFIISSIASGTCVHK